MAGYQVHGERVHDGDSSTATAILLYESGSVVARSLGSTEFLHITDILIMEETAGDIALLVDAAAAGKYLVYGKIAAGIPLTMHFNMPYVCPRGVVPKYTGVSSNRSMCIIQGFIREA